MIELNLRRIFLTENVEMKLDEADRQAKATDKRLSHEEVFSKARSVMDAR